jgi:hypothetical protein
MILIKMSLLQMCALTDIGSLKIYYFLPRGSLVLSFYPIRSGMALSNEEKALVEEAMQVYLQLVARQLPQAQVQQIAQIAKGILEKLDSVGSGGGGAKGNKPGGITDEWYKKVCQKCDKLSATGCTDKVTVKFPGKCDPILKYENEKRGVKGREKEF